MRAGVLDAEDQAILAARVAQLNEHETPRCGDFVRFACGTERRISHIWDWGDPDDTRVQTSNHGGGGYYLGDGHVSYSGSLYRSVQRTTLTRTEETKAGIVWFFHHDYPCADGGVETSIDFRVYTCTETAPR